MPRSVFTVSQCAPADCADIAALGKNVWDTWSNGLTLPRQLIDLGHPVFVAKNADNKLIGYGVGIAEAFGSGAWIMSVTIDPQYRRLGVGKQIVSAIMDFFRENKVSWVGGVISENNLASQNLAQNFGFKRTEKLDGYYEPDETVFRYEVQLLDNIEN